MMIQGDHTSLHGESTRTTLAKPRIKSSDMTQSGDNRPIKSGDRPTKSGDRLTKSGRLEATVGHSTPARAGIKSKGDQALPVDPYPFQKSKFEVASNAISATRKAGSPQRDRFDSSDSEGSDITVIRREGAYCDLLEEESEGGVTSPTLSLSNLQLEEKFSQAWTTQPSPIEFVTVDRLQARILQIASTDDFEYCLAAFEGLSDEDKDKVLPEFKQKTEALNEPELSAKLSYAARDLLIEAEGWQVLPNPSRS